MALKGDLGKSLEQLDREHQQKLANAKNKTPRVDFDEGFVLLSTAKTQPEIKERKVFFGLVTISH